MNTTTLPDLTLAEELPDGVDHLVVGIRQARHDGVVTAMPQDFETAGLDLELLNTAADRRCKVAATTPLGRSAGGVRVLAVGLGKELPTTEVLRRAAGSALRSVAGTVEDGARVRVAVSLHPDGAPRPLPVPDMVRAAGEGALLGTLAPVPMLGDAPQPRVGEVVVLDADLQQDTPLRLARSVAEAVSRARDWVNTPPNLLHPETFAESIVEYFADSAVQVSVRDEQQLSTEGFGGVLAVGAGSAYSPRVVRAAYRPDTPAQKLVLVGKGVTFDSGGLDIKPASGMLTMKCDMAGAAAVMAAVHAIADLGLCVEVVAYAGLVENMPSGSAYRPSDVLTMKGGTTVEVTNTDAEGRLVLADCLAASQEDEGDLVVDVATLTGACVRALGPSTIGLVANSDQVAARLLHAAETSGEAMWQLPLTDEARDKLESSYADLASASTEPALGMQTAAAFLERFVGERNWAHLDIAGPAWHEGSPTGYLAAGGTGSGVRTLVDLALTME